jgi:hypothetical protein
MIIYNPNSLIHNQAYSDYGSRSPSIFVFPLPLLLSAVTSAGFFTAPTLGFVAGTVFSVVLSEVTVTVVVDAEGVIISLAVDPSGSPSMLRTRALSRSRP